MDNHCHLLMEHSRTEPESLARSLQHGLYCLMSTSYFDIDAVHRILLVNDNVVPYYGVHPWYSHLFRVNVLSKEDHYNLVLSPKPSQELLDVLPEPYDFSLYIEKVREYATACKSNNRKFGIGELGLDKLFRVPTNGFYGNQAVTENVRLSGCKVTMEHQSLIFTEQLKLANELQAPVSLHCVKAHGCFFDTLGKSQDFNNIPSVVLHSYTGSVEQAQSWIKEYRKKSTKLRFSFSNYINATEQKVSMLHKLIDVLEDLQILLETDMPLHRFFLLDRDGEYAEHAAGITSAVCYYKEWSIEEAEELFYKNSMDMYRT